MTNHYSSDVTIIGGGLAGVTTALELIGFNKTVTLLERGPQDHFGGLANDAFGGMLFVNTPLQRKHHIHDSVDLAMSDWFSSAEFEDTDIWPKRWAEYYINRSTDAIYSWLLQQGIRFLPAVHWVERGNFIPGNSVPRYHIAWGTGRNVIQTLIHKLERHPHRDRLQILFNHKVTDLEETNGHIVGCVGESPQGDFQVRSDYTVIASGGMGGNLEKVRKYWDDTVSPKPQRMLNGSHPFADGLLHEQSAKHGANVTNLQWMWNYASGVVHPQPKFNGHGMSIVPSRTALWVDCYGNRIGPKPMMTSFDTYDLCQKIASQKHQYTWSVMNYKIAKKELAVSGCDTNPHIRDGKFLHLMKDLLLGNSQLINWLIEECPDVVVGNSIGELVHKMNKVAGNDYMSEENLQRDISRYDERMRRGHPFHSDDQLFRLAEVRRWKVDRIRTCNFQPINDPKHFPLIAIRQQLISRKSMGGLQTDLQARVMNRQGEVMNSLYAVGECAGFGGGGIAGKRSLEGTFLSNCIFNGRIAANSIAGIEQL